MKINKVKKLIALLLFAVNIFLFSCNSGVINTDTTEHSNIKSDDEINKTDEKNTVVPQIDPKYEKIHFGKTQDILLLEVEWHTPESYEEWKLEEYSDVQDEERLNRLKKYIDDEKNKMKNGEQYIAKSVNGKEYELGSANQYNNKWDWDPNDISQIDPDGYYIFNIYPFSWSIFYFEKNGEQKARYFKIADEMEFYLFADDMLALCDELLDEGKITQEYYDLCVIKSPLDLYVRQYGWFGEEDLKNYSLKEYQFPPTEELIKNKNDFSILFIGNSLTYAGDMPKQLSTISEMYGITVEYDSITPGGAILNETKESAVKKIQENKYDYVIFHDGGIFPTSEPGNFLSNVELLCEEARKSGAVPVLFNPAWTNINAKPDENYQYSLTSAYEKAAKINGAIIVNAGEAWVYAYNKHPDLNLYADEVHANSAGAYLTACTFASALFNLHIKDIAEDNIYHGDDALRLGQAAWEYVSYYKEHQRSTIKIIEVPDGTNEKLN